MPVGDCAETGKASSPITAAAPTAALVRIAGLSKCFIVCMPSSRCFDEQHSNWPKTRMMERRTKVISKLLQRLAVEGRCGSRLDRPARRGKHGSRSLYALPSEANLPRLVSPLLVQWPLLRNFSNQLSRSRVEACLLLFFG
jgi:hypothetical protein